MNPNYRTLHNDIGMVQRSNNGWDLWFDNGDIVKAEDFHSLQVGIIIACLTSWNYMNRYGNPTYEIFGNRAYELLKANKGQMVAYKIQQYFIECLKRMRRVYEIVYLDVSETLSEPYKYHVEFEVISISNQLVDGSFDVDLDTTKSTSYIDYNVYMPYSSNENGLIIDLWLKNEYGGGLGGEILYMYLKKGDGDYQFMGVVGKTDDNGYLRIVYEPLQEGNEWVDSVNGSKKKTPFTINETNILYFKYNGNSTYNPSISKNTTFKTELYTYHINFLNDDIVTYNDYADLTVQLYKQSLLDDSITFMEDCVLTILGSDGKIYNGTSDENGQAKIRVNLTGTTTYTTLYGSSETDETTITILTQTPSIELSIEKNSFLVGEQIECVATVMNEFDIPIPNLLIDFLCDGESHSVRTGADGKAKLLLNNHSSGEHNIIATSESNGFYESTESNTITYEVLKHTPRIELSTEQEYNTITNPITFIANVTANNIPLNNINVTFMKDNTVIGESVCVNGIAQLEIEPLEIGEYTVTAKMESTDEYNSAESTLTFEVFEGDYSIQFDENGYEITNDEENHNQLVVSVSLTDNDLPVINKEVLLTTPDGLTHTETTNSRGRCTFVINDVQRSGEMSCSYDDVSDTAIVTIFNQDVILTAIYEDYTNSNNTKLVKGVLSDAYGNKLSGQKIGVQSFENGIASHIIITNSITNSNGEYSVEIPSYIQPVIAQFNSLTTEYRSKKE